MGKNFTRKNRRVEIKKIAIGLTDVPAAAVPGAMGPIRQRDSYGEQDSEASHRTGFGGPSVIDVPADKPSINNQFNNVNEARYRVESGDFFSFLETGKIQRKRVKELVTMSDKKYHNELVKLSGALGKAGYKDRSLKVLESSGITKVANDNPMGGVNSFNKAKTVLSTAISKWNTQKRKSGALCGCGPSIDDDWHQKDISKYSTYADYRNNTMNVVWWDAVNGASTCDWDCGITQWANVLSTTDQAAWNDKFYNNMSPGMTTTWNQIHTWLFDKLGDMGAVVPFIEAIRDIINICSEFVKHGGILWQYWKEQTAGTTSSSSGRTAITYVKDSQNTSEDARYTVDTINSHLGETAKWHLNSNMGRELYIRQINTGEYHVSLGSDRTNKVLYTIHASGGTFESYDPSARQANPPYYGHWVTNRMADIVWLTKQQVKDAQDQGAFDGWPAPSGNMAVPYEHTHEGLKYRFEAPDGDIWTFSPQPTGRREWTKESSDLYSGIEKRSISSRDSSIKKVSSRGCRSNQIPNPSGPGCIPRPAAAKVCTPTHDHGSNKPFGAGNATEIQKFLIQNGQDIGRRTPNGNWGKCTQEAWESYWDIKQPQVESFLREDPALKDEIVSEINAMRSNPQGRHPGNAAGAMALLGEVRRIVDDSALMAASGGREISTETITERRDRVRRERASATSDSALFTDAILKKYITSWTGSPTSKRNGLTGRLGNFVSAAMRNINRNKIEAPHEPHQRLALEFGEKHNWQVFAAFYYDTEGQTSYLKHIMSSYKTELIALLKAELTPAANGAEPGQCGGEGGTWTGTTGPCVMTSFNEVTKGVAGFSIMELGQMASIGSAETSRSSSRRDSDDYRHFARKLFTNPQASVEGLFAWAGTERNYIPTTPMMAWNGGTMTEPETKRAAAFLRNNRGVLLGSSSGIQRKARELLQRFINKQIPTTGDGPELKAELMSDREGGRLLTYLQARLGEGDSWKMSFYYLAATMVSEATKSRPGRGQADLQTRMFQTQRPTRLVDGDVSTPLTALMKVEIARRWPGISEDDTNATFNSTTIQGLKSYYSNYGSRYLAMHERTVDAPVAVGPIKDLPDAARKTAGTPADDGLLSLNSSYRKELKKLSNALARSGYEDRRSRVMDIHSYL